MLNISLINILKLGLLNNETTKVRRHKTRLNAKRAGPKLNLGVSFYKPKGL